MSEALLGAASPRNPRQRLGERPTTLGTAKTPHAELHENEFVIELAVVHPATVVLVDDATAFPAARADRAGSRASGMEGNGFLRRLDEVNSEALKRKDFRNIVGHRRFVLGMFDVFPL